MSEVKLVEIRECGSGLLYCADRKVWIVINSSVGQLELRNTTDGDIKETRDFLPEDENIASMSIFGDKCSVAIDKSLSIRKFPDVSEVVSDSVYDCSSKITSTSIDHDKNFL